MYPLGFSVLLALAALVFLLRRWRRAGMGLLVVAIVHLWVFSTPMVADLLISSLEREWSEQPVDTLPMADAVVVLGGAFSSGNGRWLYPNASGSVDRYWHAVRVFKAGKAPFVILSGGRAPHLTAGATEARMGAMFLQDMGIPPTAIILDEQSLTTRDHAVYLAGIVRKQNFDSFIVITSARHMRRAMAALQSEVPKLVPVATDFSVSPDPAFSVRRFLPSAGALSNSTSAIHELVGYGFYRFMGWTEDQSN